MAVRQIISRLGILGVKVLGFFLLVVACLGIIQGVIGLGVSVTEGRMGFQYDLSPDKKSFLVLGLIRGFPAMEAGLQVNDRIIKINGEPLDLKSPDQWGKAIAGSILSLTIQRGQEIKNIEVTRKLLPLFERLIRVLYLLVLPLLMLTYILVGLWGIFKSKSFVTALIALVCFSFASIFNSMTLSQVESFISKYFLYYQILNLLQVISLAFGPALWLYLFINFPSRKPYAERHPIRTAFWVFLFPLILTAGFFLLPQLARNNKFTTPIVIGYMLIYLWSGVMILARGAHHLDNVLKRRQHKLMLFGIKYGVIFLITGWLSVAVGLELLKIHDGMLQLLILLLFLISQICALILPFTFFNTFFQNRILQTESAFKRRLRYIGATSALLISYVFIAFNFGRFMIRELNMNDPSFIILFVLVLSLTFSPINGMVLRWLEQKLYPEKTEYKKSLRQFEQKINGHIEARILLDSVKEWIERTMGIQPIYTFALAAPGAANTPLPLSAQNSVVHLFKDSGCFFWDELSTKNQAVVDEQERRWAATNNISLSVPIKYQGELLGIINIGKKKNEEDFNGDDLEIFQETASHTAIALKNIQLQTEFIEKKRLEKELELARAIQKHLMPQTFPRVRGLSVSGISLPCLEVGGDYFDLIPLNEGQLVMTVADVSGKGAGAALLMSNLQASLKMGLDLSHDFSGLVSRINRLLFENSLKSQFITLFIAFWNSLSRKITYINAGHIPGLLVKKDGAVQKLMPTGMGLGIQGTQIYSQSEIDFSTGDLLAIYTDGIEDYFNSRNEHYPLERLLGILGSNRENQPERIIQALLDDVRQFAGESPQYDDITLIVAKGIED